jgi:hypothetical protein
MKGRFVVGHKHSEEMKKKLAEFHLNSGLHENIRKKGGITQLQ